MRTYTFRGTTQSLPAWARELGLPESTLRSRLGKLGQRVDEACVRPVEAKFRPGTRPVGPPTVRPAPRLERSADGRAGVRWTELGRRRARYFGRADTPQANAGYARFCAEWYANQGRPAPPPGEAVSVAGLVLRFLDWAEGEYVKDRGDGRGRTFTSEVYAFRSALGAVNELYGDTPAAAFDPERLRAVQGHEVPQGSWKWERGVDSNIFGGLTDGDRTQDVHAGVQTPGGEDDHRATLERDRGGPPAGRAGQAMHEWKKAVREHGAGAFPGAGHLPPPEDELRRLRAEVKRLEMERDILKKAAAFFATQMK